MPRLTESRSRPTGLEDFLRRLLPNLPGGREEWVLVHPTQRTMGFREILLGAAGYCDGQGVYNAIRSTETVLRQIQATILREILDGCRFKDIEADWRAHIKSRGMTPADLALKYYSDPSDATRVADTVIETWSFVLRNTLLDFVRSATECCITGESYGIDSYSRYIDWITCLGMVPIMRDAERKQKKRTRDDDDGAAAGRKEMTRSAATAASYEESGIARRLQMVGTMFKRGTEIIDYMVERFASTRIMEYDRTVLLLDTRHRDIRAYDLVTGARGECVVVWEPVLSGGQILFDTPMQRLYLPVLRAKAMREHAKICQLINTAPLRVLVGRTTKQDSDSAVVSKAIDRALGEGAEDASQSATGKLVKLMINMKNMKHVGDLTDAVDAYLRESSEGLRGKLDTSKVGFGGSADAPKQKDTLEGTFHAAVVNNINTVLEGHVHNLFKVVGDLKEANADLYGKNVQLDRQLQAARLQILNERMAKERGNQASAPAEHIQRAPEDAWEVRDTMTAIDAIPHALAKHVTDITSDMTNDQYIANSFQAHYIPPYMEEEDRLSALWEQELLRVFKMQRVYSNQGHETSISYSNSSVSLIVGPYFYKILRAYKLGFLVSIQDAYKSSEELCSVLFKKSRVDAYLTDLHTVFQADVRKACAVLADAHYDGPHSGDAQDDGASAAAGDQRRDGDRGSAGPKAQSGLRAQLREKRRFYGERSSYGVGKGRVRRRQSPGINYAKAADR